ncbi:MAG: anhydro-N-acetylmuramic acid kinase [Betaproteobacteria bacterium]|nr:anhydro-N-acetylmuramic acid kinase [Betaproteobacteria bacterium]
MNLASREYLIGLMSGTSLDGVDAVLVEFQQEKPVAIAHRARAFDAPLRQTLLELHQCGSDELHRAALASIALTHHYAAVTGELLAARGLAPEAIRALACHGQTVRHDPKSGYTLQLNQPARLAELIGITVVADFRARDIAAGGQGAPLVPAFHAAVFRAPDRHRVVLNLGGIANITDLPPNDEVRGFDTGPGNMLLDAWTQRHWQRDFDRDGAIAATGAVIPGLLRNLLDDPYFAIAPPKSTGRDRFHLGWLTARLAGGEAPEDVLATLAELSAQSIAQSLARHCPGTEEVLVCGGGAFNSDLLTRLGCSLPGVSIMSTGEVGIAPLWVEAMAFAWLARQTLLGLPGNLPPVTGAAGPRILGAIYPK